ncbi:MAG TPA: hypothetical protein VFA19_14805 [Gaiellaceae bacterium]|nr:hypothetical protein [Gaiellaceae bacterium]
MTLSTRRVWLAYGLVALAMLVTYSRIDPRRLYDVSGRGFVGGGLSRVVVYLNFPVALVAIVLGLLAARRSRRLVVGIVSAALCAVVAVPGVVSQSHLDARWVNAVPALGVALALALELGARPQLVRVGPFTLAAVTVLGLVSLVWLAAELGFHETFGVFLAGQRRPGYPGPVEAAVHLGHHHGLDGAMLVATALVLRRTASSRIGRAYLALMAAYGLVNCVQDAWTEQVVKRGWTARMIPNALQPRADAVWGVILALATAAYALDALDRRRAAPPRAVLT